MYVYTRKQGAPEELTRIDHHSVYFRKTMEVQVDMARMHPPQDANL